MKKTGVFFGSTTGVAEGIAKSIANKLEINCYDVRNKPLDEFAACENLILGASTAGFGELQYDWEDFVETVKDVNLESKTVALFACGDAEIYADSFAGALHELYEAFKDRGCKIVGFTDTEGYEYDESPAEMDGKFPGLVLDDENQSELTEERVDSWLEQIKTEL